MFSRVASTLRRSQSSKKVLQQSQRRNMGGGGAFMETNPFGERVGEVFGTIAWLWVFHRFRQDGKVLLGMEHPWEHGHSHDESSAIGTINKIRGDQAMANWQKFSEKSVIPGDDDDDDDDEDEDDDE